MLNMTWWSSQIFKTNQLSRFDSTELNLATIKLNKNRTEENSNSLLAILILCLMKPTVSVV